MPLTRMLGLAFTLVILMVVAGCSGGSKSPVVPSDTTGGYEFDSIPIIGLSESGNSSNALGILGAYDLVIDAEKLTGELTPKRMLSLGESWLVSGLPYFTIDPCQDCLKIAHISLFTNSMIKVDFDIRHPFDLGNPHEPPSSKNRNDLDLFDPILIFRPLERTSTEFELMGIPVYNGITAFHQGYTTELANLIDDPSALPYFLVIDDSFTGAKNYNEFPQGAIKTFSTILKPGDDLRFELYLTMGYGTSADLVNRLHPKYFNPEFNRKNAWKVEVSPPQGTRVPALGNTWREDDPTTPFNVTVKVWDWQQGVTSIANPPVNEGDIAFASNVATVSVEIPGMTDFTPSVTESIRGDGADPRDPLIFEIPIANENLLLPGDYLSLVKVTDQRIPPDSGSLIQTDSMVHNPGNHKLEWYRIPEFATYQMFTATVVAEPCKATASLSQPAEEEYIAFSGEIVDFVLDGGPEGGNVLVAWWADWGTGEFTESSQTGEFAHEFVDEDCPVSANDVYEVRFGIEMDCTGGNILVMDSIDIVMECPTCEANGKLVSPDITQVTIMNGDTIDFELSATPIGGNVINYWADWGTGTYSESNTGNTFTHQFISAECPDYSAPPPAVDELALKVNRLWAGNVYAAAPFELSWDDPGSTTVNEEFLVRFAVELDCYPGNLIQIDSIIVKINTCFEYEIYWDNDPTDGLMNNLQPVGNTLSHTWSAPDTHMNVDGSYYVKGITYVVYSKNIEGVLSSEPSQPAHVILTGAESATAHQEVYDMEGWLTHNQSNNLTSNLYRPYVFSGTHQASGMYSVRFGDYIGRSPVGSWEGITRETPIVPDAQKRIVEFSMEKYRPG
jgi:hypothetical protein